MTAVVAPAVIPAAFAGVTPTTANNLGRDKVHWTKDSGDRLDTAVRDEVMRTFAVMRVPAHRPALAWTTSASIKSITPSAPSPILSLDQGLTTPLNEPGRGRILHAGRIRKRFELKWPEVSLAQKEKGEEPMGPSMTASYPAAIRQLRISERAKSPAAMMSGNVSNAAVSGRDSRTVATNASM